MPPLRILNDKHGSRIQGAEAKLGILLYNNKRFYYEFYY